jgi:gamma-glutamyltranspeptidase
LANCRADAVTPITADYRGLTIAELPPNGQGVTALIALKDFGAFDLKAMDATGVDRMHLELEACRAAYTVCAMRLSAIRTRPSIPIASLMTRDRPAGGADRC